MPEPVIQFAPKQYVCYRTSAALVIDGKMNESDWQAALWTDDFQDIEGPSRPQPRFHTRAKMLWDDQYFYVAAEIEEPEVWATLKKRDSIIFHDNDFEVFIDPDGDTDNYCELEVNAFSTEWDLFLPRPYRDGGPALHGWDIPGLKTAVTIDGTINKPGDVDKGWLIEIALPWAGLHEATSQASPPRPGDQWRVNFSRVEWRTEAKAGQYIKIKDPHTGKPLPEDNWVWSPQGVVNMHYPEMWGFVQFSENQVGADSEAFRFDAADGAKWALRRVYYREKNYRAQHQRYTASIAELGLQQETVPGYVWPPTIEITTSLFEAALTSSSGGETWRIDQDGHVWK